MRERERVRERKRERERKKEYSDLLLVMDSYTQLTANNTE
jgi:hypothetical protein